MLNTICIDKCDRYDSFCAGLGGAAAANIDDHQIARAEYECALPLGFSCE